MAALEIFLPLLKVDLDQRLVHGIVTAEQPDRSGEICDYESSKPYFEAWSQNASDMTRGKSLGAVRAMHGNVAAGKLTDIAFDDDNKRILVCAKIVDDDEWRKVQEGVYTGFSQGGRYVKRWPDADGSHTRYTAEPTEISLVDLPCLPGATFDVIKDGVVEKRLFAFADGPGRVMAPKSLSKAARALKVAARKLAAIAEDNVHLRKSLEGLAPEIARLSKRIAALEGRPLPAKAALRAIPRGMDVGAPSSDLDTEGALKRLASLSPEERATALMKLSLANPILERM